MGTETFNLFVTNLVEVIGTSYEVMISSNLISEQDYQTAMENIKEWGKLPYASLWYNISVAEGIK